MEIDADGVGAGNPPLMRAQYEYNGLHWRTRRGADVDPLEEADGAADEANLYYYDADWRLLEERIDDAPASFSDYTDMDRVVQRFWSHRYIDELLYMRTDALDATGAAGADGDFSNAAGYYFLCDRKYDVIAVLSDNGAATIAERVRYTPYGVARHESLADIDGDGSTGPSDQLALLALYGAGIGSPSYDPDADFDRDGAIGPGDLNTLNGAFGAGGLPEGQVSTVHNIITYSGYVYDEAVDLYLSRHRWMDAGLGRWLSRDPIGYDYAMNLYEYVSSKPSLFIDPFGLGEICRRPLRRHITIHGPYGYPFKVKLPYLPKVLPFNVDPSHEHIFYDDDGVRDNEGFFPDGARPDKGWSRDEYRDCERFPNDDALREAANRCKAKAPFCYGGDGYQTIPIGPRGNCQSFTNCVREEYKKLTNRRRICVRKEWRDSPVTGGTLHCVEWRTVEDPWKSTCEKPTGPMITPPEGPIIIPVGLAKLSTRLHHSVSLFMLCAIAFVGTACEQEIQPGWSTTPARNATQPREYWVAAVGLAGQLRRVDPDAASAQIVRTINLDIDCYITSVARHEELKELFILGIRSARGPQHSSSGVYSVDISDGSTKQILSLEGFAHPMRLIRPAENDHALYLFGDESHYRVERPPPEVKPNDVRVKQIERDPDREPFQMNADPDGVWMRLQSKRYGFVQVRDSELPPMTYWQAGSAVLRTPGFVTFDAAVVPVDAVENEPSTPANDNHGSDN